MSFLVHAGDAHLKLNVPYLTALLFKELRKGLEQGVQPFCRWPNFKVIENFAGQLGFLIHTAC